MDVKFDISGVELELSLHQVSSYEKIKLFCLPGKKQNNGTSIIANLFKIKVRKLAKQTVPLVAIG